MKRKALGYLCFMIVDDKEEPCTVLVIGAEDAEQAETQACDEVNCAGGQFWECDGILPVYNEIDLKRIAQTATIVTDQEWEE